MLVQAAALQLLSVLSTCTVRPVLAFTNNHVLTSLPATVWVCRIQGVRRFYLCSVPCGRRKKATYEK